MLETKPERRRLAGNSNTTYVDTVTSPTDSPQFAQLDQARHELRECIETSREIVRQTRELIELTGCEVPYAANDNAFPLTD